MKVEKCPVCGKEPEFKELLFGGVDAICMELIGKQRKGSAYGKTHGWISGKNKRHATRLWNRWARREARRIAKEGKGK